MGTPFGAEVPPSVLAEHGPLKHGADMPDGITTRAATTHCDGRFREPYAWGHPESIFGDGNPADLR